MTNTTWSVNARSNRSRTFNNRSTCLSCVIEAEHPTTSKFLTANGLYSMPNSHWRMRETTSTRALCSSIRHLAADGNEQGTWRSTSPRVVSPLGCNDVNRPSEWCTLGPLESVNRRVDVWDIGDS